MFKTYHSPAHAQLPRAKDEKAIWQPDEFKAASGVVVKSEGDDRAIPKLGLFHIEGFHPQTLRSFLLTARAEPRKYEILPRQKLQASDAYLNLCLVQVPKLL